MLSTSCGISANNRSDKSSITMIIPKATDSPQRSGSLLIPRRNSLFRTDARGLTRYAMTHPRMIGFKYPRKALNQPLTVPR